METSCRARRGASEGQGAKRHMLGVVLATKKLDAQDFCGCAARLACWSSLVVVLVAKTAIA